MGILSREEIEALTGYKQRAAQFRRTKFQFGIEPPQRADGLPIISHAQLEVLLHKKCGMSPPSNAPKPTSWEPNWLSPSTPKPMSKRTP